MLLNLLVLILPLSAMAEPPPPAEAPHIVLLNRAGDIGIDAATQQSMKAIFDKMPTAEAIEAANEDQRKAMDATAEQLIEQAMALLTPEQLEAAKTVLPAAPEPPPAAPPAEGEKAETP